MMYDVKNYTTVAIAQHFLFKSNGPSMNNPD